MSPRPWIVVGVAVGGASAIVLFLSPTLVASAADGAILPAVLPLGFYAAGAVAAVILPAHAVGHRLLALGALHLVALALFVVSLLLDRSAVTIILLLPASVAFSLGFAALFDALVRYPTGRVAWEQLHPVTVGSYLLSAVLGLFGFFGSATWPVVGGTDALRPNAMYVRLLEPAATLAELLPALALLGLVLMLVRYRATTDDERAQMRWPIGAVVALVAGLATTGLLEQTLGPTAQTAVFIALASLLPAALLVGILRHARDADRIAVLEASRGRIAAAAVDERRRIERDLHDGVQQHLVALLARVELARQVTEPETRLDEELRGIGESVRTIHRDLRELARGIYPAVLTDRGLADAVTSAVARLPLSADVSIDPAVASRRFDPQLEAAAYLFVLEGLTNVMKHADAERAHVRLAAEPGRLEVEVSDDGRGFDPAAMSVGTLQAMRDRLAVVGAELRVASRPAGGTRIEGLFPVD